ncbi:MAG: flagellar basal-body rod protein FlgG [Rickettsiaceae bacterium H1]|nr:flagellar basal-body rod protein FlgG [Rickettsiaceae bacterium H1]
MSSLDIAATGMHAQQVMIEVISNDVVNSNTTAFKKAIAQFQDLPYINKNRIAFSPRSGEEKNIIPAGFQVGLGVEVIGTKRINTQGTLQETGKELDIAIEGKGYFTLIDDNGEIRYSRDGSFNINSEGEIVSSHGHLLFPEMIVPEEITQITITKKGEVRALTSTGTETITIGQIELAIFPNENGLTPIGANLFKANESAGEPMILTPTQANAGEILQGYLESSNADPITLVTELLRAQRGYEMCNKAFQVSADVYKQISNIQA